MSTAPVTPDSTPAAPEQTKPTTDPYDLLAQVGGPSRDQVEYLKQQSPNGRVRLFTPDAKRVYVLRCLSAIELADIQKGLPQNTSNPDFETAVQAAVRCCFWTNSTPSKKLDEAGLRAGSAGLPETLWNLITLLSDFVAPAAFDIVSAEL